LANRIIDSAILAGLAPWRKTVLSQTNFAQTAKKKNAATLFVSPNKACKSKSELLFLADRKNRNFTRRPGGRKSGSFWHFFSPATLF
jgi:hypothetical protein